MNTEAPAVASAWSLEEHPSGVATLWIDVPGSRLNVYSMAVFEELNDKLDEIAGREDIRAIVIASKKKNNFFAGADIKIFSHITSAAQAEAAAKDAQSVFGKLADLKKPSVVAIHGACLGGGLEMALCANSRLVSDAPETVLGLPEVMIGLLPGAGGTQRLPRLVGLRAALDMILTGKKIRPQQARKMGLVDEVLPPQLLHQRALAVALQLADGTEPLRPVQKNLEGLLLEATPPGRAMVYHKAEEQVMKTTRGKYPAPLKALEAVRRGYRKSLEEGLAIEARLFGELCVSSESRSLIHLFNATTSLKSEKVTGADGQPADPRAVHKIAVLGGGLMGSGIATAAADAGYHVRVKDQDDAALGRTLSYVRKHVEERVRKRRQRAYEVNLEMGRVSVTTDYSGLQTADLVIEAVFEDMNLKHLVLKEVEGTVPPTTVFASNTSSLSIAEIAKVSSRPHAVVGMHFFSPAEKMPLLEVIVTEKTVPWATATAVEVGRRMGKHVIIVKDKVGFYTSRILGPYMVEAAHLLAEGAAIEAIDSALVEFGFPIGPLALMDEVGIDVAAKVTHILLEAYGSRMLPPESLHKVLESGRLGKKNRRGFYVYGTPAGPSPAGDKNSPRKGPLTREPDVTIYDVLGSTRERINPKPAEIRRRCTLSFINEAVRCLEEGVLQSPRDGDVGAVFGLGFPPFRGGPFKFIDKLGPAAVVAELEIYQGRFGERFAPSPLLVDMARSGRLFYE